MANSQDAERTMFQRAFPHHKFMRTPDGYYAYVETQSAWDAWQARAALDQGAQAATTASASAIKTWQERMQTTTLTWKTGEGKLAAEFQHMTDEIADLRAALARAPLPAPVDDARDAARYRWLRNKSIHTQGICPVVVMLDDGGRSIGDDIDSSGFRYEENMDEAIDAAMRANDSAAEGGKHV